MTEKLFGDLTDQLAVVPVETSATTRRSKGDRTAVAIVVSPAQRTVTLAASATIEAGAATASKIVPTSGSYGWTYVLAGVAASVKLQYLGPDGVTWMDGDTITATGSQIVPIFAGAAGAIVRLFNASANPVIISSSLMS